MLLDFRPIIKNAVLRSFLLPAGAFLLLLVAGLSSSSEADDTLFVRTQAELERLWSSVLGCSESDDPFTIRNRFNDSGGFEGAGGGAVTAGTSRDYSECGKRALRNTTSRMLVDTIEDAVRNGGVALFEERFRLTSGIGWTWGENVTGELDALIPLLDNELSDGTGQALFLQPGAIFWPGLEGENRIDANLGLVYRRHFTPDIVVGGSAFYDYDFKQGGQRVGLGLDLQSGILHTALNYYHPLDDWQEGRTGYVEQPLQGADFRLGAVWSHLQLDANLGIWRFEGEEEEKTKWRPAFGVEAGYRVLPGVFLQGGYEQHDSDDSLDSRWNAGLAFRFSLPGFEGGEGGNGRMAAPDLWELVEREKRVLYEERSGLAVEMIVGNAVIREPGDAGNEPTTTKITGVVSGRQLREDETLEVVIYESTTAEHGAGNDFTFSQGVYGVDAQTGDQIALTASAACTTSPCRMDAPANSRAKSIEIEVSALDDLAERELPEFIDMRVDVRDRFGSLVYSSNVARVTIRGHGNTVAFSSDAGTIAEEEATSFDITLRIEQPLPAGTNASVALSAAHEGGATSSDYEFVSPADSSANGTISGNTWTLPTEQREARLQIRAVDDGEDDDDESVTFTLADLTGATGWSLGSATTQTVTITDNDEADSAAGPRTKSAIIWGDIFTPGGDIDETIRIIVNENTVQFASGASAVAEDVVGGRHFVRVAVDRPTQEVTLRITASGGSASDGSDYSVDFDSNASVDASSGTVEIPVIIMNDEIAGEGDETIELTLSAEDGDLPNRWRIGSRTTHTVTITDDDEGVIGFAETGSLVGSEPANGTSTHNVALAVSKLPASPFNLVINGAGGGGGARFGSNANDDANASPTVTVSSATVSGTTLNIPVTIRADSDSEIDETIVLTIPPNGNGLPASGFSLGANTQHTITIPANDNTIGFASSSDDSLDESDAAATATVTIEIEQQLQTSSVAGIVVARSSTVVDSDYSITGTGYDSDTGILTLPANTSSVALTVTVVDDDVVEGEERLVLTLRERSDPDDFPDGWAPRAGSLTHTITITDDDETAVTGTIGFADGARAEAEPDSGVATFTVAVALSASPAEDVTVPIRVGTTTTASLSGASADVTLAPSLPSSLTFAAGAALSQNITFTIHADDDAEDDKIVHLLIDDNHASYTDGANDFSVGQGTFTLTIPANDNTVAFEDNPPLSVVEGATGESIEVVLSNNAPDGGLALMMEITGEEASFSSGSAQSVHTFTIAAGSDSSGEIPLYFPADIDTNSNEDVTLTLTADTDTAAFPTAWGTAPNVSHDIRVTEPGDTSVTIDFAADGPSVPEPATGSADHTVNLNVIGTPPAPADAFDVTVTVEAASTASDSEDYTAPTTLNAVSISSDTVAGGRRPLVFSINHDEFPEDVETIVLALQAPTGSGWSRGTNTTHTIRIAANDNFVGFVKDDSSSPLPTTAQEGMTLTLPVRLDAHAPQDFAITVTSTGVDYRGNPLPSGNQDDHGAHGSSITFTTSQADEDGSAHGHQHMLNLVFAVEQDSTDENEETFTVTLELPGGVPDGFDANPDHFTHTFTVPAHDNTVTFAADNPASFDEGGNGQEVRLLFSNNNPVPREFLLSVTSSGDDEDDITISGDNYNSATGTLMLDAHDTGASFTVTANEDDDTVSERVTLTLTGTSPPDGWEVPANETYSFNLNDDDDAPPSNTIGFAKDSDDFDEPDTDQSGSLGVVHNVELQLSAVPTEDLTVHFEFSGDADRTTLTGDYSAMATHTIRVSDVNSSNMKANYPVSILSDDRPELDETFTVTFADNQPGLPSGEWGIDADNSSYTVIIPANDNTVTFGAPSLARISEEGGTSTITATVNRPLPADETVTINVSESGAPDKDYTISGTGYLNGVWTLPTGEGNPTLTIEAVSNTDDDGERTLSLGFSEASSPDGWAVTGVTRTITIEDNDGAPSGPSVGFAQTALTYGTGSITVDISATPETSFPRDIVLNLVSSDAFGSVIAAPAIVTLENGETEATLTFSPSAIGGTGTVTLTLADPGADKDPPEPALPAGWTFANHVLTLTPATPPKPNTITVAGFGNNPSPAEGATIGMIVQALQGSGSAAIPPEGIDVSLKVDSVFVDENKGVGEDGRETPGSEFPATLHAPTVPSFLPNSFLPFLPIRTNTYTFTLTAANPTANIFAIISPDDTIEVSEKITVTLAPVSEELPDGWALGTSTYEIEVPADNQRASFVSNLPTAAVEGLSVIDPTTGEVKSAFIVLPFEAGLAKGSGNHIFAVDVTGVDHAGNAITDVYDQVKVTGQVDSGTRQFNVSRNGIVQTTEVGIEIKEDPDAELASTYTVRVDTKGLSGVANSKLTHDITVAPSDNTITFAEPSSGSITEAGGTVTIDVAINHPIPASTGDNNNPSSGPAALPPVPSILIAPAATNTALSEDYTLSVSGGTIKILPALERDEPEEDIPERYLWTLPTGTGNTTLTVRADGKPGNKNLALDFSAAAPALGWDVSGEKTRAIVLGDRVENTIGFEKSNDTLDEPDTDPSGSTGTAHNVKLQLSATPPEDLTVRFEFSGNADRTTLTGDYSATASHTIKVAEVGVDMRVDYPFSILSDETAELEETFTITLAEEQPDLPEEWKIDTANNSYTVTIPANDNSIGFASSSDDSLDESDTTTTAIVTIEIEQQLQVSSSVLVVVAQSSTADSSDYSITGTGYVPGTRRTGTLTLPANTSSVNLTVAVADDDVVEEEERLILTLRERSNPEGFPSGWEPESESTTHIITIKDNDEFTPSSKNIIGFASSTPIQLIEGGDTGDAVLQLRQPDGTAFTDSVPAIPLAVTFEGDDNNGDFTIGFTTEAHGSFASSPDLLSIAAEQAHLEGKISLDINAQEDRVAELSEEYTVTISPHTEDFPSDDWEVDGSANQLAVRIAANDNTVTFAEPIPANIVENGGVATITATINQELPVEETTATVIVTQTNKKLVRGIDYTLSVSGGEFSGNTWTLPTQESILVLTVSALSNIASSEILTFEFAEEMLPDGWAVPEATRTVTIDDIPASSTIGFAETDDIFDEPDTDPGGPSSTMHNVKLRLSEVPTEDIIVHFEFTGEADGTTPTGDYSATASHTITPADVDDDMMVDYPFSILADDNAELDETFTIALAVSQPGLPDEWGVDADNNTYTVTIPANDNIVEFASAGPSTILERTDRPNRSVTLAVNITRQFQTEAQVDVLVDKESSAQRADYNITGDNYRNGVLTIPANTSNVEIRIEPVNDDVDDNNESFTLTLSERAEPNELPSGWRVGGQTSHTINITDDDRGISFASDNPIEFTEGQGVVELFLDADDGGGVTFGWTGGGQARLFDDEGNQLPSDGRDTGVRFPATPGGQHLTNFQIVFPFTVGGNPVREVVSTSYNSSRTSLNVQDLNNGKPYTLFIGEDDDNFTDDVFIYEIQGTLRPTGWGRVRELLLRWKFTVKDNDDGGFIEFAESESSISEASANNSTDIVIYLRQPLPSEAKVDLSFNGTATSGDYTVTGDAYNSDTGILTLPANKDQVTLTITANDDEVLNLVDKTIILDIAARTGTDELPSGWSVRSEASRHTITIADDDNSIGFAVADSIIAEVNSAGSSAGDGVATVSLTLPPLSNDLKLNVEIGGTATKDDYTLTAPTGYDSAAGILTIPAMETSVDFTITAVDDALPDSGETVTLSLSERDAPDAFPMGLRFGDSISHTFTITDDESKVGITQKRKDGSLNEPDTGQPWRLTVPVGALGLNIANNATDDQRAAAHAVSATALAKLMTEDAILQVSRYGAGFTGDQEINPSWRSNPVNPDGSDDYVIGTLTINKDTGKGSFNITVNEDTFPEGQEWLFLRISDPNGSLPAGWDIDPDHSDYRLIIYGNDNGMRFAEWPRHNSGEFARLSATVGEGGTTNMAVLVSHLAPYGGVAALINVPEQYKSDIKITNLDGGASHYDPNSGRFTMRRLQFPRGYYSRSDKTGSWQELADPPNVAVGLRIDVLPDSFTENEEVIEITLHNEANPSDAVRAWGSVRDVPDTGNPAVSTSTVFTLTIPGENDNIFFASQNSNVVEGGSKTLDVLIVPQLAEAASVSLSSSSNDVYITGEHYDDANDVLTLPALTDKVTLTLMTMEDTDANDNTVTLTLAERTRAPLPSSHEIGTRSEHILKIVETRVIGFGGGEPREDIRWHWQWPEENPITVGFNPQFVHERLNETGASRTTVPVVSNAHSLLVHEVRGIVLDVVASVTGDPAIHPNYRNNPANPGGTSDFRIGFLQLNATGQTRFLFRANNDNFIEGREVVALSLAERDTNPLPPGWVLSEEKYYIMIEANDHAARFAEWPRNNPGEFASLAPTVREGDETGLLILMTGPAPVPSSPNRENLPFTVEVESGHENDVEIFRLSGWQDRAATSIATDGTLFVSSQPSTLVNLVSYPHYIPQGSGAPVFTGGFGLRVVNDEIDEDEEVVTLTLREGFGFPRAWGSVRDFADMGTPMVETSRTITLTIPANDDGAVGFTSTGPAGSTVPIEESVVSVTEGDSITLNVGPGNPQSIAAFGTLGFQSDIELTLEVSDNAADNDDDGGYTVPETVTLNKDTGQGSFTFTVHEDEIAEAERNVTLTLKDSGGIFPAGWDIEPRTITVAIGDDDNAARFAEWPRGSGSFARLAGTIVEGNPDSVANMLVLLTTSAPVGGLPVEIVVEGGHENDIVFKDADENLSTWDEVNNIFTVNSSVTAAALQIAAVDDGEREGPEEITITMR